jgi:uncharacterized protein (DUF58 family)
MVEERAFEAAFLGRLDRLILAVKHVRAARAGQRTLGRVQGPGLELENFKPYVQGDDLRFLDWNVLGRLDELMIRTHRSERKVEISIVLDASASMTLPVDDDKAGLALALAAAAAYIGMSENDAVRLVAFSQSSGRLAFSASMFHHRRESYPELRPFIKSLRFHGETALDAGVAELLSQRRVRGVIVLVSDFLVSPAQYERALSRLLAAGYEVKVVHVMGESEHSGAFPFGAYRVYDSETKEMRELRLDRRVLSAYRQRVERLVSQVKEFCHKNAIAYVPAFGAASFETIVMQKFPRLGLVR